MSLSPEEMKILADLCGPVNFAAQQHRREAIWIAAKNYWLERAAKIVDQYASEADWYTNCADDIRAIKT